MKHRQGLKYQKSSFQRKQQAKKAHLPRGQTVTARPNPVVADQQTVADKEIVEAITEGMCEACWCESGCSADAGSAEKALASLRAHGYEVVPAREGQT